MFTTIDVSGATTEALGINNVGDIVGGFANYPGFLDTNSTLDRIDVPGAKVTVAVGINNGEQIVGFFNDGTGQTGNQGFAETNGAFGTLDVPGASITQPYGINDLGTIVGFFDDAAGVPGATTYGFILTSGAFSTVRLSRIVHRDTLYQHQQQRTDRWLLTQ